MKMKLAGVLLVLTFDDIFIFNYKYAALEELSVAA